ncbi:uncharacterized [Tachysurus ichikawai]
MKTRANKVGNKQTMQQRPSTVSSSLAESDSASPKEKIELAVTSDDTQYFGFNMLSLLRKELAKIFRSELQSMLGDDLSTINFRP